MKHTFPALLPAIGCLLLLGCGGSESVSETDAPLLVAMRASSASSLGYHCKGDDKTMNCECREGASDGWWTCDGMKRWCDFFDKDKYKCRNGVCKCKVVLSVATTPGLGAGASTGAASSAASAADLSIATSRLSAATTAVESRGISAAATLGNIGTLGYTCTGTSGEKACVCKKGATDISQTCKGMDKLCEIAIGKKKTCDADGWCSCSRHSGE